MSEKENLFKLAHTYNAVENQFGDKKSPKWVKIFDLAFFLLCRSFKERKISIIDIILENFTNEEIWDFVIALRTCTCCKPCSDKFNNKMDSCKCQCWSLYKILLKCLEKDSKIRKYELN